MRTPLEDVEAAFDISKILADIKSGKEISDPEVRLMLTDLFIFELSTYEA